MRTLKVTLAYDGTDFAGWQRQADAPSVQGALEEALARINGAPVTVVGAGRTDAGVHASGQVASVVVSCAHDTGTIARALNATLPDAIRVIALTEVAAGFHARFQAASKLYHYRIVNGPVASPFLRRWAWHVPWALDAGAMREAAARLAGEHDFAAFQSVGTKVRGTVRTLVTSDLLEMNIGRAVAGADRLRRDFDGPPDRSAEAEAPALHPMAAVEGRLLLYVAEGTGFLRHMVRAIVGTLVEIGSHRASPLLVTELFDQPSRARAGPTAPAAGLCLSAVRYRPERLRLDDKSL